MKFGHLVTEAIGKQHFNQSLGLIVKYIEKNLGEKLYRFGIKKFKNSHGRQLGLMYFIGNSLKAIRFNWQVGKKSNEVESIDIWDNSKEHGDTPTIHIETKGQSLARILPHLISIIKHPSIKSIKIEEGASIDSLLVEKKITVGDVEYSSMSAAISALAKAGKKFEQIKKLTGASDANIKWYMKHPEDKGSVTKIGVTAGEKETPDEDIPEELPDEEYADPKTIHKELKDLIGMVIDGTQPSLVVSGGAGQGKTHTVKQLIKERGYSRGEDWELVKGQSTPFGLYSTLFLNKKSLIVFDDTDSIWKDQVAVNILKAALDSSDERDISWNSTRTYDPKLFGIRTYEQQLAVYRGGAGNETGDIDPELEDMEDEGMDIPKSIKGKLPNNFVFEGRVIFITNMHKSKLDDAVKNRSFVIDLTLKADAILEHLRNIIDGVTVPGRANIPRAIKEEVLEVLKQKSESEKNPSYISIRTFVNFLKCRLSGSPNWKELAIKYAQ